MSDLSPERLAALAVCKMSIQATCEMLMPEHFFRPFSEQHAAIAAALDDPSVRKLNIIASRGFGKTSLACHGLAGQAVLFRKKKFVVYITSSSTNAVEKTENLKRELLGNFGIRELFGSIKSDDYTFKDMDESFSKNAWVANGHTLVMPRGAMQQIRGLLFGAARPDLIIIDDLETLENVQSEDQRKKLWEWFCADVEKCVSRYDRDFKIVYIDTVKHEDAIPVRLQERPDWKTLVFPICGEDGEGGFKSLVPDLISDTEIQLEWEAHVAGAAEDVFYREYMCLPQSTKTGAFKREYFKHYEEHDEGFQARAKKCHHIVLVDPAKSANPGAADTAIVGCSIDLANRAVYIRDIFNARVLPDDAAREALAMADRIGAEVIGWEDTGLAAYATWPVKNLIKMTKSNVRIIELKARKGVLEKGKIERIRGLVPLYRQGLIYHNKTCCEALEAQLLSFPRAKRFDIMDALAYVLEAMNNADMFFYPEGYGDDLGSDVIEREFDMLHREDLSEIENDIPVLSLI